MELRTSGQINTKIRGTEQGKREINGSGEQLLRRGHGYKYLNEGSGGYQQTSSRALQRIVERIRAGVF